MKMKINDLINNNLYYYLLHQISSVLECCHFPAEGIELNIQIIDDSIVELKQLVNLLSILYSGLL
jgi:hypothetical protein